MKKLLTIVSVLMLTISCRTNQHIKALAVGMANLNNYAPKSTVDNETTTLKQADRQDEKPVVLKRAMRRPAVI